MSKWSKIRPTKSRLCSQRFYEYIGQIIPDSQFLVNNYEASKSNEDQQNPIQTVKEDVDEMNLLQKASHLDFSKKQGQTVDLNIDYASDFKEYETMQYNQKDQIIEPVENDFSKDLQPLQFDLEDKEFAQEDDINVLKRLSETFVCGNTFASQLIEQSTSLVNEVAKVQKSDEVIVLKQEGYDSSKVTETNFIYLFGLPYDLTIYDQQVVQSQIMRSLSPLASIKSIQLTNYKSFLQKSEMDRIHIVPSDLVNYFNDFDGKFSKMFENNFVPRMVKDRYQPIEAKSGPKQYSLGATAEEENEIIDEDMLTVNKRARVPKAGQFRINNSSDAEKLFRISNKLITTLESARERRLNKSYAIIELESPEDKRRLLREDLRVFGVRILGAVAKVEDADYKRTLVIKNISFGSDLADFHQNIQARLDPCNRH